MRKIIQILLFIISYIPLYVILFIQNINDDYLSKEGLFIGVKQLCYNNRISLILLCFIFFSILLYITLYKIIIKSATIKITVKNKIEDNDGHLSYLVTYILPFIGFNFDKWQSIIVSIVIFCILGSIYIKTNLILTNPTLMLFNFQISKIETKDTKDIILIHKGIIRKESDYNCIHLINNIYIHKL